MEVGPLFKNKIAAVIQARMSSQRLPGKVLMPLPYPGGIPLIGCLINKLKNCDFLADVVVATSQNSENDALVNYCEQNKVLVFRGSEDDVLSRFEAVANNFKFDHLIRFTADNPFIDIKALKELINIHTQNNNDLTYSEGLPLGMNFSIIAAQAIKSSSLEKDLTDQDREHVTLYFKNNSTFKSQKVNLYSNCNFENIRLTIDYPSDYALASLIYSHISKSEYDIDIIKDLMIKKPWIFNINSGNKQKHPNTHP